MKRIWLMLAASVGIAVAARAGVLTWDAEEKTYEAKMGEETARVTFVATNRTSEPVTIVNIATSCHCTAAKPPRDPWVIAPGQSDPLEVMVDLRSRRGELTKTVYVITNHDEESLLLHVTIPRTPAVQREMNLDVAFADPQAVLHGDCATCHVTPTIGKKGAELFATACLICHGAKHRASFVPDLAVATEHRDAAYWDDRIRNGKEGTLMPAFAMAKGGPFNDKQIESLVSYLVAHFAADPAPKQGQAGGKREGTLMDANENFGGAGALGRQGRRLPGEGVSKAAGTEACRYGAWEALVFLR
jgi:mono/diheme cytochrome c family protein